LSILMKITKAININMKMAFDSNYLIK
jgi:hypothetical protein